jgi:hypothetical protein
MVAAIMLVYESAVATGAGVAVCGVWAKAAKEATIRERVRSDFFMAEKWFVVDE